MASQVWMLSLLIMQMQVAMKLPRFSFEGALIFHEDFNTFNTTTWQHIITAYRGGGDAEFQYYTNRSENSYVRDGILYLKPTLTADRFSNDFLYNGKLNLSQEGCNINYNGGCYVEANDKTDIINPIQSARIRTIHSFSFRYGKVQVRAKMPSGDWLFPAIWFLPTYSVYGSNPRSGEIDLLEMHGNENWFCKDGQDGTYRMVSTLHWGYDSSHDMFKKKLDPAYTPSNRTCWKKNSERSLSSEFHIYAMEWSPDGFRFFLDDQQIGWMLPPPGGFAELAELNDTTNIWAKADDVKMAPFDQPFYIILNVAAGGESFVDHCTNWPYPKPWNGTDFFKRKQFWEAKDKWYPTWNNGKSEDSAMQVDWIRVYNLSITY